MTIRFNHMTYWCKVFEQVAVTNTDIISLPHGNKWAWHVLIRTPRQLQMAVCSTGMASCRTRASTVCPAGGGLRPCIRMARVLSTGTEERGEESTEGSGGKRRAWQSVLVRWESCWSMYPVLSGAVGGGGAMANQRNNTSTTTSRPEGGNDEIYRSLDYSASRSLTFAVSSLSVELF